MNGFVYVIYAYSFGFSTLLDCVWLMGVQGVFFGDTWTSLKEKQEKREEKLLLIREDTTYIDTYITRYIGVKR